MWGVYKQRVDKNIRSVFILLMQWQAVNHRVLIKWKFSAQFKPGQRVWTILWGLKPKDWTTVPSIDQSRKISTICGKTKLYLNTYIKILSLVVFYFRAVSGGSTSHDNIGKWHDTDMLMAICQSLWSSHLTCKLNHVNFLFRRKNVTPLTKTLLFGEELPR